MAGRSPPNRGVTARDKTDRCSARDGGLRRQPEDAIVLGGRHWRGVASVTVT
jgi:hypothetical protein